MSKLDSRTPASRRRMLGTGLGSVLALLLAGCTTPDAVQSASTSGPERGPLDEYMSVLSLTADVIEANTEYNARQEEGTATCMAAKGFEYIPRAYEPPTAAAPPEPDNESWVAQNGFGMAGDLYDVPYTTPVDPNITYVDSLAETARAAYREALSGAVHEDPNFEDLTWDEILARSGCFGEAALAIEADDPFDSPEFTDLTTAMQALTDAYLLEPEMVDLAARWSSCMADAGFAYATRSEAQEAIQMVRNNLPFPHEDGYTQALAAADDQEIDTALADLTCRDALNWDERGAEVQADLERQFITDHKAELNELIAAVQATRKK